ncbi:MAG TPA: S4 domain-containing protein [Chitinophagales bacterium]|nr:S4 domain-containing protein [Chitinophagales bacterium]
MLSSGKIRVDKWLWAVRLFKTRSQAAEACAKNKIRINDQPVKASRTIKTGEIIAIRNGAFTLQYEVLKITENRMAAKLVDEFCKNVTPAQELEKIKLHEILLRERDNRGEGRPTKKDRRELDDFTGA